MADDTISKNFEQSAPVTRDLTVALKSTEQSWNFRNIQTSEGKVDCKCVLGKVKIRQKFCQGVAEGRRRGSGKIVTGFYGELVEISGGCGCTNPLEFDQRSSYNSGNNAEWNGFY